jgi:hypothetical protein
MYLFSLITVVSHLDITNFPYPHDITPFFTVDVVFGVLLGVRILLRAMFKVTLKKIEF